MNNKINLIQIEAHKYVSRTQYIDGYAVKRLLKEPHLFKEGIASYIGNIIYPQWLGGVKEILHINRTTVGLSYNPYNLSNPAILEIHGINEDILQTKDLLEHILKIDLIRSN